MANMTSTTWSITVLELGDGAYVEVAHAVGS